MNVLRFFYAKKSSLFNAKCPETNRKVSGLPLPDKKGKLLQMNAYLKELADICGITKTLTFHLARHTFATTVTLTNGVPIESVSVMLGIHKDYPDILKGGRRKGG